MAVSGQRLSLGNTQSQPCSGWRDTDSLGFSVFAFRGSLVISAFVCVRGSKGDCVLRSEGAGAWPPPHHLWKQGSSSVVTTWRSQTSKTSRSVRGETHIVSLFLTFPAHHDFQIQTHLLVYLVSSWCLEDKLPELHSVFPSIIGFVSSKKSPDPPLI